MASSDIKAVVDALEVELIDALREGNAVRLGDLGSFRPTLRSKGVDKEEAVNAGLITSVHVVFVPALRVKRALDVKNGDLQFAKAELVPTPKKKKKKKGRAPVLVIVLTIILSILLYFNFRGNNIKLSKDERVLIIGKQNLYAVYEDKLAVKIPFELYIDSEETVENLVDSQNYENVLEKINSIVPEKLTRYTVIKSGEIKLDVENAKNIPETNIGDRRYILTSSVYAMFKDLYHEKNTVDELNENILVDVLNANGIGGYARKTGELIKSSLGMKYNAANYETTQDQSYVILNDISKEKAAEILDKLPEKYFKIKNKSSIPTLANIVIIIGSEKKINFKIDIYANQTNLKVASDKIKAAGYGNITSHPEKEDIEQSIIEYNKEDYFIAQKIAKVLGITDMVENSDLENKIGITIK